MPDPRYTIDWSPPDLTPALALLGASRARHRADDRADADAEFKQAEAQRDNARADYFANLQGMAQYESSQRHSAEVARQKAETDRKHQIEAGAAMDTLSRAARQSIGLANMRGKPYGVQFQEGHDLPANVEGPELSPEAEAARQTPRPHETAPGPAPSPAASPDAALPDAPDSAFFSDSGGPQLPPGPQDHTVLPPLIPSGHEKDSGIAGLNVDTVANNAGFADRVRLAQPQHPSEADLLASSEDHGAPLLAQAAANSLGLQPGPEGKRRIYANYQGQQFEVPEQKDTTPFGPEYDRMYQGLLDSGEFAHPQDAMKLVVAQYKSDQTQQHIADRTAAAITSREGLQGNRQDFQRDENAKYRETHEGRLELVREGNKGKIAAAAPGLKADAANSRDMSLLRQQGAAIRQTSQFSKLAANDKTVRGLMANIATGAVPLAHADAQIQLARFFRQAQPTEGEMHMLYNNLGGTADKWNQFVARMSKGDLSAEQMRQLRASAKTVQHEHEQDKERFANVARHMLGPGSGFDMMPDQAQQLYEGMGAELGIDHLPPLFNTEGGVTLGTGKRPTVAPRGTKRTQLDEIESYLDSLGGQGGR